MNEENNLNELKKIEELKEAVLKKVLSKDALERIGRIKLIKPDLALQLEMYLVQLYQAGKLEKEISDDELKLILKSLTPKKKFRIIK